MHFGRVQSLVAGCTAAWSIMVAAPAAAIDGEVLITQAKANAGNVTPGDGPGYPVTLTRSGSYKLGGPLVVTPGQNGIQVESPDVTINLNGFRMSGGSAGGMNNALIGINGVGDRLVVRNGIMSGFKVKGIDVDGNLYATIVDMIIVNSGGGIGAGEFARIQNNTIALNNIGIYCGRSCHVEGNIVSGNGGTGVSLLTGTVLGNTIASNKGYGISILSITGYKAGIGNNTVIDNNIGGGQIYGVYGSLHPNYCSPVAC